MATAKKTIANKAVKKAVKPAAEVRAPKSRAEKAALELPVYSVAGKEVSKLALPTELFGAKWRADLVHQVVTAQQANARQNRAHTKDRSEVAGGGKKPWKQKGTGQARHGSMRSPIWRHGGITFGPRSERDYGEKVNKKAKTQALLSALSKKAADGEVLFVEKLAFEAPKTAEAVQFLASLGKAAGVELRGRRNNAALIVLPAYDANALASFRNMGNVATIEARELSALDVLSYRTLVIVNPEAAYGVFTNRSKK